MSCMHALCTHLLTGIQHILTPFWCSIRVHLVCCIGLDALTTIACCCLLVPKLQKTLWRKVLWQWCMDYEHVVQPMNFGLRDKNNGHHGSRTKGCLSHKDWANNVWFYSHLLKFQWEHQKWWWFKSKSDGKLLLSKANDESIQISISVCVHSCKYLS